MKLRDIFLLIVSFCLLCSCTQLHTVQLGELADYWTSVESFCTDVAVTAIYPERTVLFLLRISYSDTQYTATVLEPEEIGDITVTINTDNVSLSFEEIVLSAGMPEGIFSEISPASAPAELIRVWKYGGIDEYGLEQFNNLDCVFVSSIEKDTVYRTLFEKKSMLPLYAEIYRDGILAYQCVFTNPDSNLQP